ncbi:MAG: ATP-binding protein [Nanoarchaeota archaeon]|nr:ATP-binding protein [Nanoarchaeota archaeon]MCG2717673.1 ATP-binding protein [Nanoarchaeota archaeon]
MAYTEGYGKRSEFIWLEPKEIREDLHECKGENFQNIFEKVRSILSFQFRSAGIKGMKGFIFWGDVGTGKTLMAKVLAKSLHIPLLFVDGATIARHLYGQSEQQIQGVFEEAKQRKAIILIDDAESVFPDREWIKGESWHVAQNNILFHCLDNLETSKTIVIMTTNKYSLLDKALKDRLYPIEFPQLDLDTMLEIAKEKCLEKGLYIKDIEKEIKSNPEKYKSVRSIEKMMTEKYVEKVVSNV